MKFHQSFVRVFILGCFVLMTNCQGKSSSLEAVDAPEVEQAKVETPPSASTTKCENGQAPKIISGECSGMWSVKKAENGFNCEFEWKPAVRCPEGMNARGLQAACYGVTIRPANANTKTADDCVAAHGKYPISAAYKLECCP